ncbi:MAG: hypothetical protein WC819_02580 [Parcubacteria group bacterium]|jgi:hypothetical protein
MTLRSYLWGLRIGTLTSFAALCAVIFFTDPVDIGYIAFVLFYITFFLTMSGLSIVILTWLWHKMAKDVVTLGEVGMAVRQGFLLGFLMSILIGMQQMRILLWWDALIALAAILLIELYFLTR